LGRNICSYLLPGIRRNNRFNFYRYSSLRLLLFCLLLLNLNIYSSFFLGLRRLRFVFPLRLLYIRISKLDISFQLNRRKLIGTAF
jgi:hypothetical protein